MVVGQRFLLELGTGYVWTVTIDNPAVLTRVANATAVQGSQGVYEVKSAGTATLNAAGGIVCPPGKACIQIAREFHVKVQAR